MKDQTFYNLSGKILIASPFVLFGDMFYKSVIYVLSHSAEGSVGIIVNHLVNHMAYKSIFKTSGDPDVASSEYVLPVYLGGPVEVDRGFLLHSDEYTKNLLFTFKDNLAVSSNTEILKDISQGSGPRNSIFVIGYTGWEAGQLEFEIENNFWVVSEYDHELIFSFENECKWKNALIRIGIDNSHFVPQLGSS